MATLQYSCLENPMDRGAWRVMVHRVVKSRTRLKQLSTHTVLGVCGIQWGLLAGISVHLGLSHFCELGQLAHTSLSAFRLPLREFGAFRRVLESAPPLEGKWGGIRVPEGWEELYGLSGLPVGGMPLPCRSADSAPGGQGARFWPKGTSFSSELGQVCCCGRCLRWLWPRTAPSPLPHLESSISRASRITDFLFSGGEKQLQLGAGQDRRRKKRWSTERVVGMVRAASKTEISHHL